VLHGNFRLTRANFLKPERLKKKSLRYCDKNKHSASGTKLERFPRYLLAFGGYLQLHELESAARCRFRGTQTHQQLVGISDCRNNLGLLMPPSGAATLLSDGD
jgi:hypothetical protein